jgi:hypothetical protein
MRRGLLLLWLAAACNGPEAPWPQAPNAPLDLKARWSATSMPLLSLVTLQLDVFARAGEEIDFAPALPDGCRGEVLPATTRPFDGGTWRHQELRLVPVRGPGELVIPPFVAKSKSGGVATTPETRLLVTSLLAKAGADVEAPGPPFPPPPRLLPWIALAGAVVLVLLLLAFVRRRRARNTPAEVVVPPHVKALRALSRLRGERRTTAAEIEAFYVAVSHVLRLYLEEAFALRAPERTTEEFLAELEAGDRLRPEHRPELRAFLQQCDLVKFAAQVPGEDVHLRTFAIAERFVESTRPDTAPAAELQPGKVA